MTGPAGQVAGSRLGARDLALVAVFAALIAALGLTGTLYPFGAVVPITAQTLGVMLAGSLLGARRGTVAVLVFLALVAAGLPLLSGGRGGLGVFARPSAGFLLGWVPGAAVVGVLAARARRRGRALVPALVAANVIGGIAVVYLIGVPVMAWLGHYTLARALTLSTVFLPGDLLKAVLAAVVTAAVGRGYPAVFRDA